MANEAPSALDPALIAASGPPRLAVAGRSAFAQEEIEQAANGRFRVYTAQVSLVPPIDWRMDPQGNRSFRFQLHSMAFLGVLFRRYEQLQDTAALRAAVELCLDWIRGNPPAGPDTSELAWYDMAVGLRAPYMAYALRAAATEGLLDGREAAILVESLRTHGAFLADGANYAEGHNHGLFQDEGLLILAGATADFITEATTWREVAAERALRTLRGTVDWEDGIHLEHSPGYHFAMTNLVTRLIERAGLDDPEVVRLRDRMVEQAGWFVLPDGMLPQVGDTNRIAAPGWVKAATVAAQGTIRFGRAGLAVSRREGAMLMLAAGYHSAAHKQADELSMVLFDRDRLMLADPGIWSYDEGDPFRQHARSSAAHSCLVVDGTSFEWRGLKPYGGAVTAVGESAGWTGILGRNPILEAQQDVRHTRLVLWKPSMALIVLDRVSSTAPHVYRRYFQLGPDLDARVEGDGVRITADDLTAWLTDHSDTRSELSVRAGVEEPTPAGWIFPQDQVRLPAASVALESAGQNELYVSVLSFGDAPVTVAGTSFFEGSADLVIVAGDDAHSVGVRSAGDTLTIIER